LLAFDTNGARLGYGGGYYDRTLAELRTKGHIVAIGIAYAGQEMAKLPDDAHDQRLDGVVTERGFRKFG
jgi:5-formyltetrahydrofolate cyclo-ligase